MRTQCAEHRYLPLSVGSQFAIHLLVALLEESSHAELQAVLGRLRPPGYVSGGVNALAKVCRASTRGNHGRAWDGKDQNHGNTDEKERFQTPYNFLIL